MLQVRHSHRSYQNSILLGYIMYILVEFLIYNHWTTSKIKKLQKSNTEARSRDFMYSRKVEGFCRISSSK